MPLMYGIVLSRAAWSMGSALISQCVGVEHSPAVHAMPSEAKNFNVMQLYFSSQLIQGWKEVFSMTNLLEETGFFKGVYFDLTD